MSNPGNLPFGLTITKLRQPHRSIPANPLLAEPMYLAGYIERMGTGTGDIISLCKKAELKEPEFIQEEDFKTILWRKSSKKTQQHTEIKHLKTTTTGITTGQATGQAEDEISETIKRIVLVIDDEMKRAEIQEMLGLKHRETFVLNYLNPSLESAFIEMTIPEIPTHQEQRYRLSPKGIALKKKLIKSKRKK